MSILRTYRRGSDDAGRTMFEYREAWHAPGSGEVVVHHGRVGTTGTTAVETVDDDEAGEQLLAGFADQCRADGFDELDPAGLERIEVLYRLKSAEPTTVERTMLAQLREEITHQLAWRGLGQVVDEHLGPGTVRLAVETPHVRKARAEIPVAARHAGVQNSRVSVQSSRA